MQSTLRPFRPISPGELLQEELEERGWTQADFSDIIERPIQTINGIIKGKKTITPETARELSQALGTSPQYWLDLEAAYRLDLLHEHDSEHNEIARKARLYQLAPVKELLKRGWIEVPEPRELNALEIELCRFLRITSPAEEPALKFATRKTDRDDPHTPSQMAWASRVKELAEPLQVSSFSQDQLLETIRQLPRHSCQVEDTRRVPDILKTCGVRFVMVEHLPHTRIDGATLWLDEVSPVVALSLRYDRLDHFWYTLMHELAHVSECHGQEEQDLFVLDADLVGQHAGPANDNISHEKIADEKAADWLIPQAELSRFVAQTRPYYSKKAILEFAHKIRVHPCIVVGRLQHAHEIPWQNHRRLFTTIRDVFPKTM